MDEQRLWAPWRLSYIKGKQDEPAPPEPTAWRAGAKRDCFLCRSAADYEEQARVDEQLLVFYRGACSQGLLNRYPYSNGHLLLAPLRHVADLSELTDEEHLELMHGLARTKEQLAEKLTAQGFNIGLNLGQLAGAGVPGHLHWHLVPRWTGDHNFMSTTAGVRVIPQALDELWRMLCDCDQ